MNTIRPLARTAILELNRYFVSKCPPIRVGDPLHSSIVALERALDPNNERVWTNREGQQCHRLPLDLFWHWGMILDNSREERPDRKLIIRHIKALRTKLAAIQSEPTPDSAPSPRR